MTEKTTLEWLNELPEPYREQAIENYADNDIHIYLVDRPQPLSAVQAVDWFYWELTPQGSYYWADLYKTLLIEQP